MAVMSNQNPSANDPFAAESALASQPSAAPAPATPSASLAPTTQPGDVQRPPNPSPLQRIGSAARTVGQSATKVAGAISPDNTYTVSDTGDVIHAANKRSPGAVWRSILGNALVGLGAGAKASANPEARSSPAAAFGAGVGGGAESATKMDQQKRDEAQENFENEQRQILNKANIAHLNASTASLYFTHLQAGQQPVYDANNSTVAALKDSGLTAEPMTAAQAQQLAQTTPGFFTSHIILPTGLTEVTDQNGRPVTDASAKPATQENVAVFAVPADARTHDVIIPQSLVDDISNYGQIAGISNAQNIKAGEEISLDSYARLLTDVQKAQKAIAGGWQTAQKDPGKYLRIVGTGKDAAAQLLNPVSGKFRLWDGPIPADLQATLDEKHASANRQNAEAGAANKRAASGGSKKNPYTDARKYVADQLSQVKSQLAIANKNVDLAGQASAQSKLKDLQTAQTVVDLFASKKYGAAQEKQFVASSKSLTLAQKQIITNALGLE